MVCEIKKFESRKLSAKEVSLSFFCLASQCFKMQIFLTDCLPATPPRHPPNKNIDFFSSLNKSRPASPHWLRAEHFCSNSKGFSDVGGGGGGVRGQDKIWRSFLKNKAKGSSLFSYLLRKEVIENGWR